MRSTSRTTTRKTSRGLIHSRRCIIDKKILCTIQLLTFVASAWHFFIEGRRGGRSGRRESTVLNTFFFFHTRTRLSPRNVSRLEIFLLLLERARPRLRNRKNARPYTVHRTRARPTRGWTRRPESRRRGRFAAGDRGGSPTPTASVATTRPV